MIKKLHKQVVAAEMADGLTGSAASQTRREEETQAYEVSPLRQSANEPCSLPNEMNQII